MKKMIWLLLISLVFIIAPWQPANCNPESAKPSTEKSSSGSQLRESESTPKAINREIAIFASGCFWKPQFIFSKMTGVLETEVGYCGGKTDSPDYKQVCRGDTGHVECVKVIFDPKKTSYESLVHKFFEIHDPTTIDRQGPDIGTQYRSVIFYSDSRQKNIAEKIKKELQAKFKTKNRAAIVTKIEPASKFYKAESYHQNYFEKHGRVCH